MSEIINILKEVDLATDEAQNEEALEKTNDVVEEMRDTLWQDWGTLTSFSGVQEKMDKIETKDDLVAVSDMFSTMVRNIEYAPDITDKQKAWANLVEEYHNLLVSIVDGSFYQDNSTKERNALTDIIDKVKSLIKAKKTKTEGGVSYSASDYAYVPDANKPSTWKLRMAEGKSGNITVAQLGRAAAAFSSGGFRGNKVELPSGASGSAKKKIRAAYKKLGVSDDKIPDSLKEVNGNPFMIFKDKETQQLRWIASYSNCYRDDDNPSEIISKESHRLFENLVDIGAVDAPELWHWHIPGSKWGTGDFVAWDEENGIAMAGGTIDPGHEAEAYAVAKETNIAVSHGMPKQLVDYDPNDKSVIIRHITKEVSDLPYEAAANKLTGFYIFDKEDETMIPAKKKEYLQRVGLTEEQISAIESGNADKAKVADALGIESKEVTQPTDSTEEVAPADATKTDATAADGDKPKETSEETNDKEGEKPEGDAPVYVTKEEFLTATTEALDPVVKAVSALSNQIAAIADRLADVELGKSKEISETPAASLGAMLMKNLGMSAIGQNGTKVTNRENLSKSGPEETSEDEGKIVNTGNPMIDKVVSSILR